MGHRVMPSKYQPKRWPWLVIEVYFLDGDLCRDGSGQVYVERLAGSKTHIGAVRRAYELDRETGMIDASRRDGSQGIVMVMSADDFDLAMDEEQPTCCDGHAYGFLAKSDKC